MGRKPISPASTAFLLDKVNVLYAYIFFWGGWIQCTVKEKFLLACKCPECTKTALWHLLVLMPWSWDGVQSLLPSGCRVCILLPDAFSDVSIVLSYHTTQAWRCITAQVNRLCSSPRLFVWFWDWSTCLGPERHLSSKASFCELRNIAPAFSYAA